MPPPRVIANCCGGNCSRVFFSQNGIMLSNSEVDAVCNLRVNTYRCNIYKGWTVFYDFRVGMSRAVTSNSRNHLCDFFFPAYLLCAALLHCPGSCPVFFFTPSLLCAALLHCPGTSPVIFFCRVDCRLARSDSLLSAGLFDPKLCLCSATLSALEFCLHNRV